MIKTKKRKKYSRMHGRKMGTAGTGARKNKRKSGNKGGIGMSGSGKRADHKKTKITKKYGNTYFGKRGVTSRKSERDKRLRINLGQIQKSLHNYKNGKEGYEINLENYKILGDGEVKEKLIIKAKEASKSAIEKVKKAGGEINISVPSISKKSESREDGKITLPSKKVKEEKSEKKSEE